MKQHSGQPAEALSLEELEDLFENAPCGYVAADKDGRIRRANATLAAWVGIDSAALVGQRFSDLLTIGGKLFYETHFAPMLRMQGSFSEVALELTCVDGRKLPVLVNATERYDPQGKPRFIWITVLNASERRRYERNLLEAKRQAERTVQVEREEAELREQFIAVLGHDLRNPLASISSGLKMLSRQPLNERGFKVLGFMEGSTVRAQALISNLLDFARARLGGGIAIIAHESTSLEPIIEQIIAELRVIAPARRIDTKLDLAEPVQADPGRIGQLLSNLLSNALTHGAATEPVRVNASTTDEYFQLSVANGGDPIPPKVLQHLFQPFFRGAVDDRREGLGLGLYIASEIAKAHGGTLTASSDAAETRFTFRMPRCAKPSTDEA